MTDFAAKILEFISRPEYQPITLKAIAKRVGFDPDEYADVRGAVKRMIRTGQVELARNKTLRKPDAKGAVIGTFRRTSKGFGFVRPAKSADRATDIYIPANASLDASTGDEVAVKITKRPHTPGLNPEGRIVKIIERSSGLFVGTYYEEGGAGYVKVDGTTFHSPLSVGDPGAKGARPKDKVVIEIARYPTPDLEGEGVITELLGPRGKPGIDTISVIRAFNIPDQFDDETLEEARRVAKQFSEDEIGTRKDFRDQLTVTIDPATARDFDDAITLTRDDRGFWTLGVHIADVGHFVRSGSALDRTVRKRGTSVYLPDRVIPMLPEVISNSLASLQEGRVRYTMSVEMEFDAQGIRTHCHFSRSVIRVNRRFSYEDAYAVMKDPQSPREGVSPEVGAMLARMLELAMILRNRRFARGALELTMPEIEIDLGEQGQVVGAHLASNDESHQVIEEFMLAANEAVAEYLTEHKVGFLRRVHADPEPSKLRQFAEFVRSLGFTIETPQSRFELQRILDESAERPERYAVHYGFLRSLKQAIYTPEHEGHYALASEHYCHFTSPIRRYPDLQVHRQLATLLNGHRPKSDPDELAVLAEHCTRTERRAEAAERELIKVKLLTHLESRIGETFHAVIIGVEEFGFFAQLVELPVEGLVHVTSLADDYYYLEAETHTLIGRRSGRRFRLGDHVVVHVARVDVDRRQLDLVIEGEPVTAAPPPEVTVRAAGRTRTSAQRPKAPADRKRSPKGRRKRRQ